MRQDVSDTRDRIHGTDAGFVQLVLPWVVRARHSALSRVLKGRELSRAAGCDVRFVRPVVHIRPNIASPSTFNI